jgi:branched-chain amino acid transport system permease protein
MDFYLGLATAICVHTMLGLSSYVLLLTGQVSLAQAGFAALGAYLAGILTVVFAWHIIPALLVAALFSGFVAFLVGFPALRVRGVMLVVATIAFSEAVRVFLFNFRFRREVDGRLLGPDAVEGFHEIRWFQSNGWTTAEVTVFFVVTVALVMALLWWLDRSRAGTVLRAVGQDETAAQAVGINLTAVKVAAMTAGGVIAGLAGGLYAHYATHIEHFNFGVALGTFAIAYPILGGLTSVFGTLAATIFVQGFLVEGLRFIGDWRTLLFGALIILAMNLRPKGLLDPEAVRHLKRLFGKNMRANHVATHKSRETLRRRPCGRKSFPQGAARADIRIDRA